MQRITWSTVLCRDEAEKKLLSQENDLTSQTDVELGNFQNFEGRDLVLGLDQKLAALFGTTYDRIVVNDKRDQAFIQVPSPDAQPTFAHLMQDARITQMRGARRCSGLHSDQAELVVP